MLTADLVRARRKGDALLLSRFRGDGRERAVEMAARYIAIVETALGGTRRQLDEAWEEVPAPAREQKIAAGLRKLLSDRCVLEVDAAIDPIELREEVFTRASLHRRELPSGTHLDRSAIVEEVAAERELSASEVERLLYADLRGSHRLLSFDPIDAEALVHLYELGQEQAVLLRAESVEVDVRCASPGAYRQLFRKLKFLRLLHRIEARDDGSYRIEVDGPYSLFSSVTKYGLALAMLLPTLRECDGFDLRAQLRWGKERRRLSFEMEGGGGAGARSDAPEALLVDDARRLLEKFAKKGKWEAKPSAEIFSLPGVGVCVPDLVFLHRETGEMVYLEVLGYWSRDAVWKRVELAEAGLEIPIIFAVPQRLRVSEAVLDGDLPAALMTYKGVIPKKALEERLAKLIESI